MPIKAAVEEPDVDDDDDVDLGATMDLNIVVAPPPQKATAPADKPADEENLNFDHMFDDADASKAKADGVFSELFTDEASPEKTEPVVKARTESKPLPVAPPKSAGRGKCKTISRRSDNKARERPFGDRVDTDVLFDEEPPADAPREVTTAPKRLPATRRTNGAPSSPRPSPPPKTDRPFGDRIDTSVLFDEDEPAADALDAPRTLSNVKVSAKRPPATRRTQQPKPPPSSRPFGDRIETNAVFD